MKPMWEDRYSNEEYAYGEDANLYFKTQLQQLEVGKILFPAEGEGRNAVHAAAMGWETYAFDQSVEGCKKALALAHKNKVTIDYIVGEIEKLSYPENSFDVIVLIYAHFPSQVRKQYHQIISRYLKSGGTLILEGFSKHNLKLSQDQEASNGPKDLKMLFSTEEISSDFENFEILELKEELITLDEGPYHQGKASVIRFVGKKLEVL